MFGCCSGRASFTSAGGSSGGSVTSFNGRTGAVVSANGDYNSTQVTNSSGVTGGTVTAALDALAAAIVAVTVAVVSPLSGNGSGGSPITLGIADSTHWQGGLREVADLAARNAIPAGNRNVGATVYEVDNDKMWRLIGGIANGNWVDVTIGVVSNAAPGIVPLVGSVSTILQSTGTASNWVAPLTYDSTFLSPTITQTVTAGATGQTMLVQAQNAATTGGCLKLQTGTGGTTQGEFATFCGATQFGSWQKSNTLDFLSFGNNPSSAGFVRLPPGTGIKSRDFAFGFDMDVYTSGTGFNSQVFGSSLSGVTRYQGGAGGVVLTAGGVDCASIASTVLNLFVPALTVGAAAGASGFTASVTNTNSGSSASGFFRVRAMGTTNGNTNGANFEAEGGRLNGTGLSGGGKLKLNQDDTQANMWVMFQWAHIASGGSQRRVTALNFPGTAGAGITATQSPANAGDLYTFVGDAAVVPSADSVGGHAYYSDGAKPAWRFNGTNLRFNGTSNTASVGTGALTLPALAIGYLDVQINGTQQKVPYYAA